MGPIWCICITGLDVLNDLGAVAEYDDLNGLGKGDHAVHAHERGFIALRQGIRSNTRGPLLGPKVERRDGGAMQLENGKDDSGVVHKAQTSFALGQVPQENVSQDDQAPSVPQAGSSQGRQIGTRLIPPVLHEWREPRHDAFEGRNVWSLFNAFTGSFKGNLTEPPRRTEALHGLLDNHVGLSA
ncbi:hypothetical protein [Prosthecobacter sp.]